MKYTSILSLLKGFAAVLLFAVFSSAAHAQVIAVSSGSAIANNGTKDFGNQTPNTNTDLTFSVTSTGANLAVSNIAISGDPEFTINQVLTPASPVVPGTPATFIVRYRPTAGGSDSATLVISSDATNAATFTINLTGSALAEITVADTTGTPVPIIDGVGTVDFGPVQQGVSSIKTFTITNSGTVNLTGLALSADNVHFTLSTLSGAALAAGATRTFTATFAPTAAGGAAKSLNFTITSSDADEGTFDIALSGTRTLPTIAVESPIGTPVANNDTIDFGNRLVSAAAITRTVRIFNSGLNTSLTVTPSITGTGSSHYDVSPTVLTTVVTSATGIPQGFTDITVSFDPTTYGTFNLPNLVIATNDPNQATFTLNLNGTGTAPDIGVQNSGGSALVSGGTQSFGTVTVGDQAKRTLTINNTGNIALTPVTLTWVSGSSTDFTLVTPTPSNSVAAATGSTTFGVNFRPTAGGTITATLNIATNDPDTPDYTIVMSGIGNSPPSGEDAFRYSLSGTPANAFTSLNPADVNVILADKLTGDDVYQSINIGFRFYFYENVYESLAASTNALLTFGSTSTVFTPQEVKLSPSVHNFIAPFWTDLITKAESRISYTTRGLAPNQVFILEYLNMAEYNNPTANISFQVLLYEGSNTIEIQYKDVTGFSATREVCAGIENLTGLDGLKYKFGAGAANLPVAGTAILFKRPVVVKVDSTYLNPLGVVSPVDLGLVPSINTYKRAFQDNMTFEAPEFLYLDRFFSIQAEAGTVGAPDQAWYRLVNDGYAINGKVVQGTQKFFTTTLDHDIELVWRWRLEYAAIVESGKPQGGSVNDGGRKWHKHGEQFVAKLDTPLDDLATSSGIRLRANGYYLYNKDGAIIPYIDNPFPTPDVDLHPVAAGSYVESRPVTMVEPVRLKWDWTGEVRYRYDAVTNSVDGTLLNGQSFIRIWTGYNPMDPVNFPGTPGPPIFGVGRNFEYWVPIQSKVTVGAFYRSQDRRVTLSDFAAPPAGDLAPLGMFVSALKDDPNVATRVARIYTTVATAATDVHWVYAPTVFRAEIPIGQSFDPTAPNVQLIPDLATNGVLKLNGDGPGTTIDTKIESPAGSILLGAALRWDAVGSKLFPVQPGSHRVSWPDQSGSGETFIIEIVTNLPGLTAAVITPLENDDGTRKTLQITPPIYDYSTDPMAAVSSDYPAAPAAHYRHIYDTNPGRRPPTKLDIDAADEWDFQDLPFAEASTSATANSTADGVPFSASGTGRSVILYSKRPNSDEIANGDLTKETLAVRVVSSTPLSPISRDDSKLVLGRRALHLGSSNHAGGAYAVVQTGGAPATNNILQSTDTQFVVDFWLNAADLESSAPVSPVVLSSCVTTSANATVTCASTLGLIAGMNISGTNIPDNTEIVTVTGPTTLLLSNPASATGTGLSLSVTKKPVTVFSTGGSGLQVILNEADSTTSATYRGNTVTHILPKSGASWRHYAVHVFTYSFFGVEVTIVDFYLDGIRQEVGFVSSMYPGNASSTVSGNVNAGALRFGFNAAPSSNLFLDNFRVFNLGSDPLGYLQSGEVRRLRSLRNMISPVENQLRSVVPLVSFDFETAPTSGIFVSQVPATNVGVGTVTGSGQYTGVWAYTDLQEVASRIESTLDSAAFRGTGYILNAVSNYNSSLYSRDNEIGTWGPIFPVNHNQLFTDATKRLEVAYYENFYLTERALNPNVAWPYIATGFNDVVYPTLGKDKDKAIYIASRIGSEGVDRSGKVQQIFDGANYADLQIYHQSNLTNPGYNPNEEHALVAPGGRAALKVKNFGDDVPNSPPLAAFALQRDINSTSSGYSSDPWVLIQVNNVTTGDPEMAAYQVFKTRTGVTAFPRPSTAVVNAPNSGLSYEAASNPEDGFLMIDAAKAIDFSYQFEYPAMAGDLLIPPYPLNLVIGNVSMSDARGNSLQVNSINQRCLWRDVNKNAWVVSGNGKFFHQFFYPMRGDFHLSGVPAGTPVAWIPDGGANYTGVGANLNPVKVLYNTFWRSDYPKLKRGETATYQGGEYFSETPGAKGLPALVAMAATEIVYDSSTPSMSYGAVTTNRYDISSASARLMRPLDRRENPFTVAQMGSAGFTPAASTKVLIIAERWYFKELPGSLQKRFYFDSLAEKLVFRGRLNEKESGDSNLTSGPDPLNILEPNVLTSDEYKRMRGISSDPAWMAAIDAIYLKCQNPDAVTGGNTSASAPARNLQGVKNTPVNYPADLSTFWVKSGTNYSTTTSPAPAMVPLDSFGVGSALVPNPSLLTQAPNGSLYVTIAENNRSELSGAPVSLHIIEIVPDRYRGAIKVIEGSDAFSEKVTLQHNGEFGANTGDLYYEWWIRDAGPLDLVADEVLANGTLKQTDANGLTLWQEYIPAERAAIADNTAKHLGLHTIVFEGRPDVVLADKLVLMRYRHKNEAGWNLVPFEFANANTAWKPGSVAPFSPAPFQWAGAANSPQLQADGSKRYIPQLIMGWVKRVLDRINPYEARYNDFFSNESPATYSSQIQIAGGPYAGKVALNPDKNVIENTGLIELYRTVLDRARELSIDNASNGNASDGINQALLLAATRLSVLYELLASEAYSDAQDSTINSGEDSALVGIASYTHSFQNMEADLQHEELALLRGTDFGKSYPVYNRVFWNYAKGLGEAAYNVNYNIYDVTKDGFINEDDARKLYPQGHGDAWGHYVSSLEMHYILLQHPGFTWRTRSELYSLMQNVLEVDFLDEKTFSRLAAARARAGRDIVRNTYRLKYTQNPNGQWQGYTDGADPARAWGVSEWAHRAGQSAHFDWAVANALLPEEADAATPIDNPENLDRIERSASVDDIGAIAAGLHEIQVAMDEANKGVNPLGFDSDAMAFDIELQFYDNSSGGDRRSQFEQIYSRATDAANNALATLEMATQSQNKLRALADDTDGLIQEAMAQDLDFRNRLIEIFGRPYDGTIGVGKAYPEGYLGADTLLYAYLDKTKIDQIVPKRSSANTKIVTFDVLVKDTRGIMDKQSMINLYNGAWNGPGATPRKDAFKTLLDTDKYLFEPAAGSTFTAPYTTASKYAFQTPADNSWGKRTSYGTTQAALNSMLAAEIELDSALSAYSKYIRDLQSKLRRIESQLAIFEAKNKNHDEIAKLRKKISDTVIGLETAFAIIEKINDFIGLVAEGVEEGLPLVNGFSNDFTSVGRGILNTVDGLAQVITDVAEVATGLAVKIVTRDGEANEFKIDLRNEQLDQVAELEGMIDDFQALSGAEQPLRNAIGTASQSLESSLQEYITAQATGFRILRERESFNKILAAKVQKNRYQDMVFRLSRNEAMTKYQSSFNAAAQYAWLAARAYDYETSLDPGHPAAPGPVLDQIVKERQLGYWADGAPQVGRGGLAEILAQLKGNFSVLKGQLGISNPQTASETISLRQELFRIYSLDPELDAAMELDAAVTQFSIPQSDLTIDQRALLDTLNDPGNQAAIAQAPASNDRWKDALKSRIVPDLNTMPEFVRYCRPFATGVQPGLVIRFASTIEPGKNFFGQPLMADDHTFSTANYATKIHSLGVWLDDYYDAGLSTSPRAYLVPIGNDYMRTSSSAQPLIRSWSLVEQRIPAPFVINQSALSSPDYIPTLDGVDGSFGELRRHGDFRVYHNEGDPESDGSNLVMDSRLISRSVWNSQWMLIIPGSGLGVDPNESLIRLADNITDIKLYFATFSHQGQ